MKLNSLLGIGLFLSSSIAYAKKNECLDIYKKFNNSIEECITDNNGQIATLNINNSESSFEEIESLLSYNSIKQLTYEYSEESYFEDEEHPFLNFNFTLNGLTHLENLKIGTFTYELRSALSSPGLKSISPGVIAENTLKDLNNLKNITLYGIKVSQKNIDELASLPNLEQLSFEHCDLEKNISFKSLTNIKSLVFENIYLTKKNFEDIFTLKNIESLSFIVTSICQDNFDLISNLTNLKYLQISDYYNTTSLRGRKRDESSTYDILSQSMLDTIGTLTNLETLIIGKAESELKFSSLKNLSQLKYLYLYPGSSWNYNIYDYKYGSFIFEDKDFDNFKNLKTLIIGQNGITQSSIEEISNISSLKELKFEHVNLKKLNLDSLANLKNLQSLSFYDSVYIEERETRKYDNEIPKFVFDLNNLKNLYMNKNYIETLPNELGKLKNLESFTFKNNKITKNDLSLVLSNLPNLTYLDLSSNGIDGIPKEISNLKNLQHLDLQYNQITNIPEELATLKDLEYLDLNQNKIDDTIPESFNNLEKLTYVDFNYNYDLKGESLKNKYLVKCGYGNTNVCQAKEMFCFYNVYANFSDEKLTLDKCSSFVENDDEKEEEETTTTVVESVTTIVTAVSTTNDIEPTESAETTTTVAEVEPTQTTEPTQVTCKALDLGYQCCTHCHSIYEDSDGLWGAEHGKWCGIPDHCSSKYENCWSIKHGYPCCDHCKTIYTDKSGKWGVLNKDWCDIPTSCQ